MTAATDQREDIDKLMSLTVVYLNMTQGSPGALLEQRSLVLGAITSLAKKIADREKPCARRGCTYYSDYWLHDRKDWLRTGHDTADCLHHNFYSGTRFER